MLQIVVFTTKMQHSQIADRFFHRTRLIPVLITSAVPTSDGGGLLSPSSALRSDLRFSCSAGSTSCDEQHLRFLIRSSWWFSDNSKHTNRCSEWFWSILEWTCGSSCVRTFDGKTDGAAWEWCSVGECKLGDNTEIEWRKPSGIQGRTEHFTCSSQDSSTTSGH